MIPKDFIPWSRLVSIARSGMALAMLGTLLATPTSALFRPLIDGSNKPHCDGFLTGANLFCMIGTNDLAKYTACLILVLAIVGYLPQVIGILHFWVAYSIHNGVTVSDGGDQIALVVTLLLLPHALCDPRINHWQSTEWQGVRSDSWRIALALGSLIAIKFQLSVLYLQAAIAKTAKGEWQMGNNIYYTSTDVFGFAKWLDSFWYPLVTWAPSAALLTWGTIALEILLGISMLINSKFRKLLFVGAISLHSLIAILMGL